jgi:ADP-heptose:LPS heptosyltransferase
VCAAVHGLRGVRARLRAQRFDVALDLQGLLKSALVVALTRAPVRIGFSAGWSREPLATAFSNRRVRPPAAARHVVDQYLALLEPLGLGPPVREFRLPTDPVAESLMDEFLAGAGLKPRDRLVVLNPGAGRPAKRWPLESFTALARRVTDDAGARVVVVWGPGEHAMARAICAGAEGATPAPPTDVPTLLALVRRASVVVASDTGPLHLAAAAGTACVGLYGPTRAERNGPYGGGHRALQSPDGRMAAIGVDAAYRAVTELLS